MRINTNVAALNAQRNLWGTQEAVDKSMGKLSSGLRINRAADDAAGLTLANTLATNTRGLQTAVNNATQGNAVLSIMEGSASTIQNILQRQQELYIQYQSSGTAGTATQALVDEFTTLSAEVNRIIQSTQYQGSSLFGSAKTFWVGNTNSSTNDSISVNIGLSSVSLSSIQDVSSALATVNSALASIGQAQNRLDYTIANLKSAIVNQKAAESTIRDLDMAEEMATYTKNNILAQAGTAMLAQANQSSQGVLSLLR